MNVQSGCFSRTPRFLPCVRTSMQGYGLVTAQREMPAHVLHCGGEEIGGFSFGNAMGTSKPAPSHASMSLAKDASICNPRPRALTAWRNRSYTSLSLILRSSPSTRWRDAFLAAPTFFHKYLLLPSSPHYAIGLQMCPKNIPLWYRQQGLHSLADFRRSVLQLWRRVAVAARLRLQNNSIVCQMLRCTSLAACGLAVPKSAVVDLVANSMRFSNT